MGMGMASNDKIYQMCYFFFVPIFSASSIVSGSLVLSVSGNKSTVSPDVIANPPKSRSGKDGTYLA